MKKYSNPTTEVTHVSTMLAICEGTNGGQPNDTGHAPARRNVF